VLLAVEVLIGEEEMFLVSGFPVEKEMILPRSVTLDEVERMVLSSGTSAAFWYFWALFSWLELD